MDAINVDDVMDLVNDGWQGPIAPQRLATPLEGSALTGKLFEGCP